MSLARGSPALFDPELLHFRGQTYSTSRPASSLEAVAAAAGSRAGNSLRSTLQFLSGEVFAVDPHCFAMTSGSLKPSGQPLRG